MQPSLLPDSEEQRGFAPLAVQLRPGCLSEVLGQRHLVGPNGSLTRMLVSKRLASMILWGPPGSGKTTIARLLARESKMHFRSLSAVLSGVKELREIFSEIDRMGRLVLFVDEMHRFHRGQQDAFLSHVESGALVLIGATTENPSFALNGALLSRCDVLVLRRLTEEVLEQLLLRAEGKKQRKLPLTSQARQALIAMADGDGRAVLNLAENLFAQSPAQPLTAQELCTYVQRRAPLYDKKQEEHYNLISALHKSLRGSDVDASLYWLARMLVAGEDPNYIARRITRFASEDVGLADPRALTQALSAWQAFERIGSPEGELALAQAVVYLASAPKSNAVYRAFQKATKVARAKGSLPPPLHIRNAPTQLMKDLGYGAGYRYDHHERDGFSGQSYFPEGLSVQAFYLPSKCGYEKEVAQRMQVWQRLRRTTPHRSA